jgi:hypothetical protein
VRYRTNELGDYLSFRAEYFVDRPPSILVWISGALGDTILAYPALKALRAWAPLAAITAIGHRAYLGFALDLGLIDRAEDVDGPDASALFASGRRAGHGPAALAVVWSTAHADLERHLLAAGVSTVVAAHPRGGDGAHQAAYLLSCLAPLGILSNATLPTWTPIVSGAQEFECLPASPAVLIHAGAGARWKRWPLDGYLSLATELEKIGCAVRWSFGETDDDLRDAVRAGRHARNMLPLLSLRDLASFIARCDLVVSGDTGIAHLAALCGTPTLTLFGPTDPRRWAPLGPYAHTIQAPNKFGGSWAQDNAPSCAAQEPLLRRCVGSLPDTCRCLASIPAHIVVRRSLVLLTSQNRKLTRRQPD